MTRGPGVLRWQECSCGWVYVDREDDKWDLDVIGTKANILEAKLKDNAQPFRTQDHLGGGLLR